MSDLERRLIVARALATEHGMPLGFYNEADQLDWDRKAQAVLRELDGLGPSKCRLPGSAEPERAQPSPNPEGSS